MPVTYDQLAAYRVSRAMPWFGAPWDLNLLIARSDSVGEWDDWLLWAFTDDAGRRVVDAYRCTGDAWNGEWTNPTNPDGCVYVLDQHVPGGLKVGLHKGRPALRQNKPYRCVRWPPDRGVVPTVTDLEAVAAAGGEFTGWPGTHVHNRASARAPGEPGTDDSEGCTVALYYHQHAAQMELVETQRTRRGSDTVSPTYCKLADILAG